MHCEQLKEDARTGRPVVSAMYLRKSREERGMDTGETLSKHRAALTAYAEQYGYRAAPEDIYEEVVSGESLFARPKMLSLMEAVSQGKYEAVLCMDMQRLGRGGMYDQGFILDTFKFSETLIVTPERIYDLTREADEQAAEMETFLSRGEYRLITKRLRRGLMQSIRNGAYPSNPPFGYRQIHAGKLPTLEIVPEEAAFVRQIFQLYADGSGCTQIQRLVNAMGARGHRGSALSRNTVRLILENPVYIGKVRWNKTSTVKTGVGEHRRSKTVYHPPEQWEIIDGRHPPIISQALWDAVQTRRKSRTFQVDSKRAASPLAGLVRCGRCGRLMNMQGQSKGAAYLLCPTPGCCAGARFSFVEQTVLSQLESLTRDLEVPVSDGLLPDTSAQEQSLRMVQERLSRLKERRGRLYSLLEDGAYSPAVFSQRMQLLSLEEARAKETAQALQDELRAAGERSREAGLCRLRSVTERYQNASVAGKKELVRAVISEITYAKEKKTKPADFCITITLRDFF